MVTRSRTRHENVFSRQIVHCLLTSEYIVPDALHTLKTLIDLCFLNLKLRLEHLELEAIPLSEIGITLLTHGLYLLFNLLKSLFGLYQYALDFEWEQVAVIELEELKFKSLLLDFKLILSMAGFHFICQDCFLDRRPGVHRC